MTNLDEDKENIIPFSKRPTLSIAGGDDRDPCWLNRVEVGTVFSVQRKGVGTDFALGVFQLVGKTEKGACYLEGEKNLELMVNPVRFCNVWELYEIHRTPEMLEFEAKLKEQQEKEKANDTDTGTV